MATQPATKYTEEEYLRRERAAQRKSEFIHGEIFEVAGGTLAHARIAMNVGAALVRGLSGGCGVCSSDLRIQTPQSASELYPDLSVVCGKPEFFGKGLDVLTNPVVIVEVLSPSSAAFDRGEKFELYREIPSLTEYVLVNTDSPHVEHFGRQADDSWVYRDYRGLESTLVLVSIGCSVALKDVYAGVLD